MKRALFTAITLVLALAPACKTTDNQNANTARMNPPVTVKISLSYDPPNITIDDPVPDPAKIVKGEAVIWNVTVSRGGPLDITIDDFADDSGKRVDVFGEGSTYKFSGVGSSPIDRPTGPAGIVSGPEGFKYRIKASSPTGDEKVLDPRIIVSAG